MKLQQKLQSLPAKPGVYLMKAQDGEVIYVGKAVNLRNRVRSYFQQSHHHSPKTRALVDQIADIEYIVTDSEIEALILENNLIKEHSPWFNVKLKDDKNYPYIKVTVNEEFPRILLIRKRIRDGARYYGPYTNAAAVRNTIKFIRKLFAVRSCRKNIQEGQQDRPCLNYHIGRCSAPCAGLISKSDYNVVIDQVCKFLEGHQAGLIPELKAKMQQAGKALEFEKAAKLRDRIAFLEQIVAKQKIISTKHIDQDILGYARAGDLACVQVFLIRSGKLIGREHFILDCHESEVQPEIIAAFIKQYYHDNAVIPKEVLISTQLEESSLLSNWLSSLRGNKVYVKHPQRGSKKDLVKMATENAQLVLDEIRSQAERKEKEITRGLWELQNALKLSKPLRRIEAYDVSNTQGSFIVASMVVMIEGKLANEQYRRFKIKSVTEGPNDYLAMQEVIRRRFARGLAERQGEVEGNKFSDFPDLVLIDGGKGQLSSAIRARDKLEVRVPFIGLAKQFEEIYIEGKSQPLLLPRESQGLYLVQRIRDEAHRFAIAYHRNLRGKTSRKSALDQIPGIGPKRKKALLQHFGSVRKIREASIENLIQVEGINDKIAAEIYQQLHR